MSLPLEIFDRVVKAFVRMADVPDIFRARAACRTFAVIINNHLLSDSATKVRHYMDREMPQRLKYIMVGGSIGIIAIPRDEKMKRQEDTLVALNGFFKKQLAVVVFNERLRSQNYEPGLRIMLNIVTNE